MELQAEGKRQKQKEKQYIKRSREEESTDSLKNTKWDDKGTAYIP